MLIVFYISLKTNRQQTDYQTHKRNKHYAEDKVDIKPLSTDEITQGEMSLRMILKIGSIFPHHHMSHDDEVNEEEQSYYQDSMFIFDE